MQKEVKFNIPEKCDRKVLEFTIIAQFIRHNQEEIRNWVNSRNDQNLQNAFNRLESLISNESNDYSRDLYSPIKTQEDLKTIMHSYNFHYRLNIGEERNILDLQKLELIGSPQLLPPPLPCDYVDESTWCTGNEKEDDRNWLGHGYFWKYGEGEMCKDLSSMDYDMIEENFFRLKKSKVLVADYDLLKKDFPQLQNLSDVNINEWVLLQSSYISEGQCNRITNGGDLFELIDVANLDNYVDKEDKRFGLRMKGGGRAASFFVDNAYGFNGNKVDVQMMEVKGCGTSKHQPEISIKACGFLPLVDALKEMAYQKLQQHLAEKESQPWSTVQYYGIVDTGINFKSDAINPATGYTADRCVLVLRQRQSRIVSAFDEVVYYSVARKAQQDSKMGQMMRDTLEKYGVSSEQFPMSTVNKPGTSEGEWNIQCDATMTHMVDFSHWFTVPESPLPSAWKISESSFCNGFKLGGKFLHIFDEPLLLKRIFQTDDVSSALATYEVEEKLLAEKFKVPPKDFGKLGQKKPDFSWSWFLEVDDSEVMNWANREGKTFHGSAEDKVIMNQIKSWLNF